MKEVKIEDNVVIELYELCEVVSINAINAIYEYQKNNTYVPLYYKYPYEILKETILKEKENKELYKKFQEKCQAINCGIPLFSQSNYNTPKNYGDLLKVSDGRFNINCNQLDGFNDLLKLFYDNESLNKMASTEAKYIEYSVVGFISNIVNRYLYITKKFKEGEIDTIKLKKLIIERITHYVTETLKVNICIPICFLDFDLDIIEITKNITICRMNKEFQLSRFNIANYESTQESEVVQCAAFMIKIDGYQIENKYKDSVKNSTSNYWNYPLEIIDDMFAAIRIVSGFNTGYGQLIIEPINWSCGWIADLLPLYGAKIRAFNRGDADIKFINHRIYSITNEQIDMIKEVFDIIREKRECTKKNKIFNKVFISIERLNRCMLREKDDDTALDAIIGIETLLSGDTHGEITYTISNRISVVVSMIDNCPYSAQEARRAMKIIYGFRSDIVHGRNCKKNTKITINGQERHTKDIAIEFLRYSLLFILKNQEFLDVKQFENALDDAIGK